MRRKGLAANVKGEWRVHQGGDDMWYGRRRVNRKKPEEEMHPVHRGGDEGTVEKTMEILEDRYLAHPEEAFLAMREGYAVVVKGTEGETALVLSSRSLGAFGEANDD